MAEDTHDLYFAMQNLNRATIKYAADMIKVGMNLPDAKTLCENYLLGNGVDFAIHQMPILEEQISKLSFALTHIQSRE